MKDVMQKVFTELSPEDVLVASQVSREFKKAAESNSLWRKQFHTHFPHVSGNNPWYALFKTNYQKDYQKLTEDERRLFSLVKMGDMERLRKWEIHYSDLVVYDGSNFSLTDWAKRQGQSFLDFLYKKARCFYYTGVNEDEVESAKIDDDVSRRTILYWALVCRQPVSHIQALIRQGSRIDERYRVSGTLCSTIHLAARAGCLETVKILCNENTLNQRDGEGRTPLSHAAFYGHVGIVRFFLSWGASINAVDHNGETALYRVLETGRPNMALLLIRAGADLQRHYEHSKFQPIHIAVDCNFEEVVIELIDRNPTLLNQVDSKGLTPLYHAIITKNERMRHFLISKGAVLAPLAEAKKVQPIHRAARDGELNVVKNLIEADQALLDARDYYGQTPLLWAAVKGHRDIVEFLLEKGANVYFSTNVPGDPNDGKTPLMWAQEKGHREIVERLAKADPWSRPGVL